MPTPFATVDEYIASFPPGTQAVLQQVRRAMHAAVPGAEEKIGYGIAALTSGGRIAGYFSGWKHHVSIHPVPEGDAAWDERIAPYRTGKGTLRFPLSKPIPHDLITEVAARLHAASQARGAGAGPAR